MYVIGLVLILVSSSNLMAGPTLQDEAAPVGMILQTNGEVFLESDEARDAARMGELLSPGPIR